MRPLNGLNEALKWIADRPATGPSPSETQLVTDIIAAVRADGDAAVRAFTQRFDGSAPEELLVPAEVIAAAHRALDPELLAAVRLAISRVRSFYSLQQEHGFSTDEEGANLSLLVRPLASVGCYIPAGQAPLFSTLIMSAVPAQVAGVPRIALASPPGSNGLPHEVVLGVASELGISEVYAVGGAQAIAALAHGTETVRRVDKVVGPGNRFVTEAKRLLYGQVGIDSLAGPTETLVLADDTADVGHVIADLLAQAEHDMAVPVLVTDSAVLRDAVITRLHTALSDLPTAATARESLERRGAAILVTDLEQGLQVANGFAPEHLCLLTAEPELLLDRVENAGGIFLGHGTMEALGDYVAGPSHVMPTGGSARFASFLNLRDFQKVMPVLRSSPELLARIGPTGALLARSEGLEAHARAIESRLA